MKLSPVFGMLLGATCAALLAGCGKSEPAAPSASAKSSEAKPAARASAEPATTALAPTVAPQHAATSSAAPAISAMKKASDAVVTSLQIPDFQTASVEDLSEVASQALTSLSRAASSTPAVVQKVSAVKTALESGKAVEAVSALAGLGEAAKAVPGMSSLVETVKQVVSAWALKQGFDASKISGVLGALQNKDYGTLASQAVALLGSGTVSGEQQGILQGVLGAFGIDAGKTAGAMNAVKGLLGK